MKRISVVTLGCKTNQAETAAMVESFDDYKLVEFGEIADVCLINTCTVTNRTDYKSRNLIRKALQQKKLNPAMKLIVTGCYSQRNVEEVLALGDVDLVVDNQNKLSLREILKMNDYQFEDIMKAETFNFNLQQGMMDRSRAFQKIQDGCDYYCSYCAVPYARGHNRSAKLEDALKQARTFVDQGYQEIVLGGVNLGLYRDDDYGLTDLLDKMVQIDGIKIIRLSSLEPQLFSDKLIELVSQSPRIAPHFHIAIQSCSNSVLKRMGRVYDQAMLEKLLIKLQNKIPNVAIGADLICAFPGESVEEFDETYRFIESNGIAYLHVFQYSKRKGTPAATLPDQIDKVVSAERSDRLHQLSETLKAAYRNKLLNERVPLRGIIDNRSGGEASMLSDHYIRVYCQALEPLGTYVSIQPDYLYKDGLR